MGVIGILLVGYSSRGHQLVFNYPLGSSQNSGHLLPLALQRSSSGIPFSGHSRDNNNIDIDSISNADISINNIAIDPQILSDVLSPKEEMGDRMFKLAIDDIVFVGHPTLLNADRPGTGHRFAREIQRKRLVEQLSSDGDDQINSAGSDDWMAESNHAHNYNNNLNSSIISTSSSAALPTTPTLSNRVRELSFGASSYQMGSNTAQSPQIPTAISPLLLHAINASPTSPASSIPSAPPPIIPHHHQHNHQQQHSSAKLPVNHSDGYQKQQQQLSMFNLVFILSSNHGQEHHGRNCQLEYIYNNVVVKLSAALKYEQLKRGYLKREMDIIMGIRDAFHNGVGFFIEHKTMSKIMQESSLARLLAHTFHSIVSATDVRHIHLDLNSSVDISILIEKHMVTSERNGRCCDSLGWRRRGRNAGGMTMEHYNNEEYSFENTSDYGGLESSSNENHQSPCWIPLRPYHAVLLLYHAEEILKSLPADSAMLLHDLIEIVTPTQSLEELAFSLSCSLAQIYRLVSHLVYWKKAKVINVISPRNVYMVSKDADLTKVSRLVTDLNVRVKDLDFGKILSELCKLRPFSTLIRDRDNATHLEIIAQLLRNNLIEEYSLKRENSNSNTPTNKTTVLTIPRRLYSPPDHHDPFQSTTTPPTVETQTSTANLIIRDPINLTDFEKDLIGRVAGTQPQTYAQHLFMRLVPYFDGVFRVEEIAFREALDKFELKKFLGRYREFLIRMYSPALS